MILIIATQREVQRTTQHTHRLRTRRSGGDDGDGSTHATARMTRTGQMENSQCGKNHNRRSDFAHDTQRAIRRITRNAWNTDAMHHNHKAGSGQRTTVAPAAEQRAESDGGGAANAGANAARSATRCANAVCMYLREACSQDITACIRTGVVLSHNGCGANLVLAQERHGGADAHCLRNHA